MKVLHVTTSFVAQSAGYRLHKGLRDQGINSNVLTGEPSIDDPSLHQPRGIFERGSSFLKMVMDPLPLKMYPHRTAGPFSPAMIPDLITRKIIAEDPSLVHLHWICGGFIRIESLKKIPVPLVWTLHDSWPFTGGCHIPYECMGYHTKCGNCPVLGSSRQNDLSRRIWNRKNQSWKNIGFTIVPVSNWLADCARQSSLFRNQKIEVIHNGIDTTRFKPIDKIFARNALCLPLDKKIILFGAVNSTSDQNKGFSYLVKALSKLTGTGAAKDVHIVIFGGNRPVNQTEFGFDTTYTGRIYDDTTLALLYAASDVFVAPSLSETLSNTVMESLACGTPAVAFHVGGIPELIEHEKNGYLASPFDPDDLARGIECVLSDEATWRILSHNAREKIGKEFDIQMISKNYIDLYARVMASQ